MCRVVLVRSDYRMSSCCQLCLPFLQQTGFIEHRPEFYQCYQCYLDEATFSLLSTFGLESFLRNITAVMNQCDDSYCSFNNQRLVSCRTSRRFIEKIIQILCFVIVLYAATFYPLFLSDNAPDLNATFFLYRVSK